MWYIILGIILFILVLFLFCALKLSSKYDNDDKKCNHSDYENKKN